MAEIDIEEALGDLKDVLQPIHAALSHVTREVRPADAAFTQLCKLVRVLQVEVVRLRQLGFDHVDLLERSQAETTRLRAENADLVSTQAIEMNRADSAIQNLTASRDSFLKENGRLKKELLTLSAENAMLLDRRSRELTARELEWFRQVWPWLDEIVRLIQSNHGRTTLFGSQVLHLIDRLKATPRPRAGEFATTCSAEDTNVLGDSYAQFANGSKGVGT